MITKPDDVLAVTADESTPAWDGQSVDPVTEKLHPNKETTMPWAEHQRIVCDARKLLAGKTAPHADKTDRVGKAFAGLKRAYEENASGTIVRVSKGIHQPHANPHLQLTTITKIPQKDAAPLLIVNKFHLNVSAEDTAALEERFVWQGVQFTFLHDGQTYGWPLVPVSWTPKAPQRRNSISFAKLNDHLAKQAEEAAALEAEAQAQAAKDAFASARAAFELQYKLKVAKVKQTEEGRRQHHKYDGGATIDYQYDSAAKAFVVLKQT